MSGRALRNGARERRLHSIHKRGVARELTRINRYLLAAGLPTLSVEETDDDRVNLVETPPPTLPRTFAAHQESSARTRKKTNAMRATLAQTLVSKIGPDKLLKFKACMKAEGLSDSTIQEELAMLKHLFNCARGAWNWAGFDNPMHHVEVPQGGPGREAVLIRRG